MIDVDEINSLTIESKDRWKITCHLESVGPDLLCRIHGGDHHLGAVARSQWIDDKATTECLVMEGHREDQIALHSAHRLCRASHRNVVCLAGIHFDDLKQENIQEISNSVVGLVRQAARLLEDQRLQQAARSSKLLHQMEEGTVEVAAECAAFLATSWETLVVQNASSVTEAFAQEFDGQIRIFAPLYLSNVCINNCVYCGFRLNARFKRRTLDVEQAISEARTLAERGYRTLDLVTGEVPTDRFVDYVAKVTGEILDRTDIRHLNLNLGSLTTDQYRRLRTAGATGYHLYQETYDPQAYFRVHEGGQKRDMARRLAGLHRAIDAGFETVGLGILLGLSCLNVELARLIRHATILLQHFPHLGLGFSLPRIRQIDLECSFVAEAEVSDTDFMKAMLFLRLKFPKANLTLTTRENQQIRDGLLPLGISKMSAGVSTSPGGYTDIHQRETKQFVVTDERSLKEIAQAIEGANRIATYE